MATLTVVGRPLPRIEGVEKVTGRRRYSADVLLPGALWGKSLRSPLAHARIVRIDASQARALPGVRAVLTGRDVPDRLIGRRMYDMPLMARDEVRYVGERVAAVAADDPDTAEEALGLIEVEYEELPAVFDPLEATRPEAPIVHPQLRSYRNVPPLPDIPNVHSYAVWKKGDVAAGFAEADVIFEDRFTTSMVHQGYIEPHACAVEIADDGTVRVWSSAKQPFQTQAWLSEAIGVPKDRVVVMPISIGGDFGGKGFLVDEPVAYFLAKASGRPVKMIMTYVEELMAGVPRHAAVMVVKTGVKRDGRLVARQASVYFNTGAYAGNKPQVNLNLSGSVNLAGNYRVPHVLVESYCVYTHQVPCGHMRAPAEPQTVFASESHMDMIAHRLGMDPYEFRRLNALVDGDEGPLGEHWSGIRCKQVIERAAEASGWTSPKPGSRFGRGMAVSNRDVGAGKSGAIVRLLEDGQVCLLTGVPDVGTGAHTVLRQIVAEVLKLPPECVVVVQGDTSSVPFDSGSGGSRVTHVAGKAAFNAATKLKQRLLDLACELYGWPEGTVVLEQGELVSAGNRVTLQAFAPRALRASGGVLEERDEVEVTAKDAVTFSAHVAEVEVDRETGQVRVHRLVAVHDIGQAINPLQAIGQVEGGAVFGLGQALMEELRIEGGRISTLSLGEYKLPNIQDIPSRLETILIQDDVGPVPFGGKSVGEVSTSPVAPAIANAIFDAVGVRLTDLPLSAERLYRALKEADSGRTA